MGFTCVKVCGEHIGECVVDIWVYVGTDLCVCMCAGVSGHMQSVVCGGLRRPDGILRSQEVVGGFLSTGRRCWRGLGRAPLTLPGISNFSGYTGRRIGCGWDFAEEAVETEIVLGGSPDRTPLLEHKIQGAEPRVTASPWAMDGRVSLSKGKA